MPTPWFGFGEKWTWSLILALRLRGKRAALIHTGFQLIIYRDIIMSTMESQITNLTIAHSTVYSGTDKKTLKTLRHWILWGEFIDGRWIPRTKGQ